MLDLEPIRERLAAIDRPFWRDACEPIEGDDTFPADRVFVQNAPDDIAALIEEAERLRAELTGLRTYMTRSIAADLAGVPEALEILDGLADEDMATVDRWVAAMSPRCQHEAELERLRSELAKVEPRYIVRLEPGVWIAASEGDPGRTCVRASARQFPTERSARRALSKARRFREFPKAMVECVP